VVVAGGGGGGPVAPSATERRVGYLERKLATFRSLRGSSPTTL
jgi:hypothetical protein